MNNIPFRGELLVFLGDILSEMSSSGILSLEHVVFIFFATVELSVSFSLSISKNLL